MTVKKIKLPRFAVAAEHTGIERGEWRRLADGASIDLKDEVAAAMIARGWAQPVEQLTTTDKDGE